MVDPRTVLQDPMMLEVLGAVKKSLPVGENLDKAKMRVIVELVLEVIAIVESLKDELTPITDFDARVKKVEQAGWAKINHLIKTKAPTFLLADTPAGASHLSVIAGLAVSILVR